MIRLPVTLDAPNDVLTAFGAGALIEVERAPAEDGVFAAVGTLEVEADTEDYLYFDPDGISSSWYRWRTANAAQVTFSGYTAPYQGALLSDAGERYASLADLVATYRQAIPDAQIGLLAKMDSALTAAQQAVDDYVGFDFLRHPAAGTEVRIFDGNGLAEMIVYDGIVPGSLTKVELRVSDLNTWTEVASDGWYLPPALKEGHPVFELRLASPATFGRFPLGSVTVRLTAAFGWPAVPATVKQAQLDKARQILAWDPTLPGGPVGPEELGQPLGPNRMPDSLFRLRYEYGPVELGTVVEDL